MPVDALATLGARASAGMVLTPQTPEYSISSIRRINVFIDWRFCLAKYEFGTVKYKFSRTLVLHNVLYKLFSTDILSCHLAVKFLFLKYIMVVSSDMSECQMLIHVLLPAD